MFIRRPVKIVLISVMSSYYGKKKKMKITRKLCMPDGEITTVDKIVEFDILPGWKSGNKVTFKKYRQLLLI